MNQGSKVWMGLIAYFPLIAIGLEVLWVFFMFLALIFAVGDTPYENTPAKDWIFSIIASFPVALGTLVGVCAILIRCPNGIIGWISLLLGTAGCGVLLFGCLIGLVR